MSNISINFDIIFPGTGKFEVSEDNTAIVSGLIRVASNPASEKILRAFLSEDDDEEEVMNAKDIYKELKLRGYYYTGPFCSLKSTSISMTKGHIAWTGNWMTFIDGMIQLMLLQMDTRDLYLPTRIRKLVIDTKFHQQEVQKLGSEDIRKFISFLVARISRCKYYNFFLNFIAEFPARIYKNLDIIVSGGIELRALVSTTMPRQLSHGDPILEKYTFVAHRDGAQVSLEEAIRLSAHIAIEYYETINMKTIEVINNSDNMTVKESASLVLAEVLKDLPLIQPNIFLVTSNSPFEKSKLPPNVRHANMKSVSNDIMLAVGIELLTKNKNNQLQQILSKLKNDGFILTREKSCKPDNLSASLGRYQLDIILEKSCGKENIILLKKKGRMIRKTEIVYIKNNEFSWLKKLNSVLSENEDIEDMRVILVSEGDYECGLLGFVNSLRKESSGEIIRSVFIQDSQAPEFSLQNSLYAEQFQLDLPINVLRPGKVWGSYRHLPLPSHKEKPVQHAFIKQLVCI
jgi:fatty acid synthase